MCVSHVYGCYIDEEGESRPAIPKLFHIPNFCFAFRRSFNGSASSSRQDPSSPGRRSYGGRPLPSPTPRFMCKGSAISVALAVAFSRHMQGVRSIASPRSRPSTTGSIPLNGRGPPHVPGRRFLKRRPISSPFLALSRKGHDEEGENEASASELDSSKSPSSSRRKRKRKDEWITCSSTKELVEAIKHCVRPGHRIAELGAQLREVSTTLCESLDGDGRAVLVDVERKFPSQQQQRGDGRSTSSRTRAMRLPGDEINFFSGVATFHEIPHLDQWRKPFLEANLEYDVLVLDLSAIVGNDLEWTSLSVLREFVALFEGCHLVLVISVSLNQWAARLNHCKRWISTREIVNNDDGFTILPITPYIIATVGVHEYRETIPQTVRPGDAVLELGCHLGTTTALLYDAAAAESSSLTAPRGGSFDTAHCIGVDVGIKIVQSASKRHPDIYFAVGDARKTAGLLRIQQDFFRDFRGKRVFFYGNDKSGKDRRLVGFDVIYVDVGGLSGSDGLLEALTLLSSLMYALEPRCIVIKSLCVRRLSTALIPAWRILHGNSKDDECGPWQ